MYPKSCEHCGYDYNATKSNQKYCSNSCRTRACYERNQYKYVKGENYVRGGYKPSNEEKQKVDNLINQNNLVNSVMATMIGNGITELVKKYATADEDKPVTKADFSEFIQLMGKFEESNNRKIEWIIDNQVKIGEMLQILLERY